MNVFLFLHDNLMTKDEGELLKFLPKKLKSDLAIQVHFDTLSKVAFFQVSTRAGY